MNFSIDVKNDLYICTFLIKSWPVCNSISRPSAFMPSTIVMYPLFKSLIKPNFKTRLFFISGLFSIFDDFLKYRMQKRNCIQSIFRIDIIWSQKLDFAESGHHYSPTNLWKPSSAAAASQKLFLVNSKGNSKNCTKHIEMNSRLNDFLGNRNIYYVENVFLFYRSCL